jgi:hypothetical protein
LEIGWVGHSLSKEVWEDEQLKMENSKCKNEEKGRAE